MFLYILIKKTCTIKHLYNQKHEYVAVERRWFHLFSL